jgi:hypothetical protein
MSVFGVETESESIPRNVVDIVQNSDSYTVLDGETACLFLPFMASRLRGYEDSGTCKVGLL